MFWLLPSVAIAIHDRQLAEHGGSEGVRDVAMLESALARPRQLHAYAGSKADVADLAASLAVGLVRNMPFVDGNKRTAHVCYRTFLGRNCVALDAPDSEKFLQMIGLAAGTVSEEELAGWLRRYIRDSVAIHISC